MIMRSTSKAGAYWPNVYLVKHMFESLKITHRASSNDQTLVKSHRCTIHGAKWQMFKLCQNSEWPYEHD